MKCVLILGRGKRRIQMVTLNENIHVHPFFMPIIINRRPVLYLWDDTTERQKVVFPP